MSPLEPGGGVNMYSQALCSQERICYQRKNLLSKIEFCKELGQHLLSRSSCNRYNWCCCDSSTVLCTLQSHIHVCGHCHVCWMSYIVDTTMIVVLYCVHYNHIIMMYVDTVMCCGGERHWSAQLHKSPHPSAAHVRVACSQQTCL